MSSIQSSPLQVFEDPLYATSLIRTDAASHSHWNALDSSSSNGGNLMARRLCSLGLILIERMILRMHKSNVHAHQTCKSAANVIVSLDFFSTISISSLIFSVVLKQKLSTQLRCDWLKRKWRHSIHPSIHLSPTISLQYCMYYSFSASSRTVQ